MVLTTQMDVTILCFSTSSIVIGVHVKCNNYTPYDLRIIVCECTEKDKMYTKTM